MKTVLNKMIAAVVMSLLVSQAYAATDKNERVLIVVSELQEHGPQNLNGLYNLLEELTRLQTNLILGDDYR